MTTGLGPPRQGRVAPKGPYEGVPGHLQQPLERWLEETYTMREAKVSPMLSSPMDRIGLERLAAYLQIDARGMSTRQILPQHRQPVHRLSWPRWSRGM